MELDIDKVPLRFTKLELAKKKQMELKRTFGYKPEIWHRIEKKDYLLFKPSVKLKDVKL